LKYFIFTILSCVFSLNTFAIRADAQTAKNVTGKNQTGNQKDLATAQKKFPVPPKILKDQYTVFFNDKYEIFKTKKFEKLELTESCFKNKKVTCQAYEFAQIKPKSLEIKSPGMNNMSAIHCEAVGGQNLLALDYKNNQYNFCRFGDGSMVNSWSMNYKHFPSNLVR
jgi:putative hemolysin